MHLLYVNSRKCNEVYENHPSFSNMSANIKMHYRNPCICWTFYYTYNFKTCYIFDFYTSSMVKESNAAILCFETPIQNTYNHNT